MSAYKKGGEPSLRPFHIIIRAKMGFQRDIVPLEGGVGDSVPPPQNPPFCLTSEMNNDIMISERTPIFFMMR